MHRSDALNEIVASITSKSCTHLVKVAIDGIDASGKTTLANDLVQPLEQQGYQVIRASVDGFHNPKAIRRKRGSFSPEGYFYDAFNYAQFKATLLDPLSAGGDGRYCTESYDFRQEQQAKFDWKHAGDRAILLVDGVFLQRSEIDVYWDFRIWVDVPFAVALDRACQRDVALFGSVDTIKERYAKRYFPAQELYFSLCNPQKNAQLIVENSDPLHPRLDRNVS